jgi:hypothetical protein
MPASGTVPPDVSIHLNGRQQYQPPLLHRTSSIAGHSELEKEVLDQLDTQQWIVCGADGDYIRLRYADDGGWCEFVVDPTGRQVWVSWSETVTLEEVTVPLVGPILGCVLRRRGVTCLHASAVTVSDRAILLVGDKGAGKSTTMAALLQLGCTAITDDVAPLSEKTGTSGVKAFFIEPGHSHLRLRPDAALELYGSMETLHPLCKPATNRPDKHYLDLSRANDPFPQHPVPLAAVYVLQRRDAATSTPAVIPVLPVAGVVALTPHTYVNFLLNKAGRAHEFGLLSRLAATVPVRHVRRPDNLECLPQICEMIIADTQALIC